MLTFRSIRYYMVYWVVKKLRLCISAMIYTVSAFQAIQQIIPSDNGYYYITYTIAADEGRADIKAIMNSVKFK